MKNICMIVQQRDVHGGIAAVTNGYYGSSLEKKFNILYIESYCDGSKTAKLKKALKAYVSFHKLLRKKNIDAVHIHTSFGPSFYREIPFILMSCNRKIPVINHIHGSAFDVFYENASDFKKKLVRKWYGKCSRMIVLTEHWKKVLSRTFPIDRIEVVSNYSKPQASMLDEKVMKKRFEAKKILFLGVITKGKGMEEAPFIIQKVVEKVPKDKFIFGGVGDTSLVTNSLSEEIVQHNVVFPGWVTDDKKDSLLKDSMLFFLPSHMEAMPMSILDAFGYALPCVATNIGGIPQLVEDKANGTLCELKNTDQFARAIISYLTDYEFFKQTSENCIKIVNEKFSFDIHVEKLEKIYVKVISDYNNC